MADKKEEVEVKVEGKVDSLPEEKSQVQVSVGSPPPPKGQLDADALAAVSRRVSSVEEKVKSKSGPSGWLLFGISVLAGVVGTVLFVVLKPIAQKGLTWASTSPPSKQT